MRLLFALWCVVLLCGGATEVSPESIDSTVQESTPKQKKSNKKKFWHKIPASAHSLQLLMAGDALLHTAVFKDAEVVQNDESDAQSTTYKFDSMFEYIAPFVAQADLAFYNQETILGGSALGLSSYPAFNSPQEFGDTMLKLGFNMVSLANNHTLDKGERGVMAMLRFWHTKEQEKPDLCIAGSYTSFDDRAKVRIYEKNGISYAMLAYTYGTNGIKIPEGKDYLVNVYTKQMLKTDIENLRDKVDLLIVSMHWGIEYEFSPSDEQREFARFLADLGVDIIIGNHPHVIQPIEWIDDTLVIYSLGNFISGQKGTNKRIGMLASARINLLGEQNKLNPQHQNKAPKHTPRVQITDVRADLIYTYYDTNMRNFKLYLLRNVSEKMLPNHKKIYDQYTQIIKQKWLKIGL